MMHIKINFFSVDILIVLLFLLIGYSVYRFWEFRDKFDLIMMYQLWSSFEPGFCHTNVSHIGVIQKQKMKKRIKSYDISSEIVYMLVRQINSRTTITAMNLYKTNWGEQFENIFSKCKHRNKNYNLKYCQKWKLNLKTNQHQVYLKNG